MSFYPINVSKKPRHVSFYPTNVSKKLRHVSFDLTDVSKKLPELLSVTLIKLVVFSMLGLSCPSHSEEGNSLQKNFNFKTDIANNIYIKVLL